MISKILISLIGLVFLFSSLIKINDSKSFMRHLAKLDIVGRGKNLRYFTVLLIGLETALSAALILNTFALILIPFTVILLLSFVFITYWSTSTGRVEDCGCYGGLLAIEPKTSILLDASYMIILISAYLIHENKETALWQWFIPVAVIFAVPFFAYKSLEKPFYNFTRLKAGNRWGKKWVDFENVDSEKKEFFFVFLGKDCPYCKRWVPLMNIMNTQKDLPTVVGIMNLDEKGIEEFKQKHLIRFPIKPMRKTVWNTLIEAVPTAALVKQGNIIDKWEGKLPEEYAKRIQDFYDSIVTKSKVSAFAG